MTPYHVPVMLNETLELLSIDPNGIYVDVTYGGGGHSREILARLGAEGKLIAFDQDADAKRNLVEDERLEFVASNFAFIESALEAQQIVGVDGIIADLGISSHQIDTAERGFSYRFDAPLDMRMNTSEGITAAEILNTYEETELYRIFKVYGELPNAKKVQHLVVERRASEEIRTTGQLETILQSAIPHKRRAKFLAQVYQALRIEVNQEMEALEKLLLASLNILKPGGRFVVMSYHSLEDRMVKNFFRSGNLVGKVEKDFYGNDLSPWKRITRKAIQASQLEIDENNRARSARLRAVERK